MLSLPTSRPLDEESKNALNKNLTSIDILQSEVFE
jgi:hypothetical protein